MNRLPLCFVAAVLPAVGCGLTQPQLPADAGADGDASSSPCEPPIAAECAALCDETCSLLALCGVDAEQCADRCSATFACPGESSDHDRAMCSDLSAGETCESACAFAESYIDGLECSPDNGSSTCGERDYCDCGGPCEPLIDTSTGCFCECEEPFTCGRRADDCACICGGATYLGCAPRGDCAETSLDCGDCSVVFVDGCPTCDISGCS